MDVVTKGVGAAVPIIERRLELHAPLSEGVKLKAPLIEDGFRYLVFDEFRKAGVDIMRVDLEYPRDVHAKGVRPRIDAVILNEKGEPETAIEFKYIRKHGAPAADAGRLLADFARLRDFPKVHRFAALLADGKFFQYLNKPSNGLNLLFSPSEQEFSEGNIPKPKALLAKVGCALSSPVRVQVTGSWEVGNDHRLFVWRVKV